MTEKEKFILPWTVEPFPSNIRKEASAILEDLRAGKSSLDIEGYTLPLEFGTGGIRGVIGYGMGRMNEYTVGRVALGFCRYLLNMSKKPVLVISYDSRRKSTEFASVTAGIAASLGIKVKLFSKLAPTPILSFAVRHYKATGGVMITASHNPPEYNGFKAYLSDGGQLVAPDDKKIIDSVNKIQDWSEVKLLKKSDPIYKKMVSDVEPEVFEKYKTLVFKSGIYNKKLSENDRSSVKVVYSPLHGTGGEYMKGLLTAAGYSKFYFVKEQQKPDGEFPTVKYPNPEEKEALELTIKTSKAKKADIFIATDPDADRLGVGIKRPDGEYELLNGNQVGSIMCAYLAEKVKESKTKTKYHIFKTIVTTDLQENIAKKNGVACKNVLTGFKFIAEQMAALDEKKEDKFLFGGEESYGYLPVEFVRDKDSLSSALLILEILSEKKDILTYLDEVYMKYGLFMESLKSITMKGSEGQKKIVDSMEILRNTDLIGKQLGTRKVSAFIDYKNKVVKGDAKKSIFSGMPSSNVIQLKMEGNGRITIRPSGTEPKVKVYGSYESLQKPSSKEEITTLKESLLKELKAAETEFIKLTGLN
ncbi:MAG: phospho-sugar mutase [Leptospiraceae bacterium]|nr:phospho-sugar mutase [Leptospiraceae bacterium]